MQIAERIATHRAELSPQERRAADCLLAHLDDLGTYRAGELADLARVSKATMSRLFRSLGYAGFDEVRDQLRAVRFAGEPRSSRDAGPVDLVGHAVAEADAIRAALAQPQLAEAASVIAAAGRVLVVGWRNSYPVALHLREQLIQARRDVTVAPSPGQVVGEELTGLGADDVVVAVGFRRRPRGFAAFLGAAAATGAQVVLIADPSAAHSPGVIRLECGLPGSLAFDSYAPAMSLAAALADGVLAARGEDGRDRIVAITTHYDLLGEVE